MTEELLARTRTFFENDPQVQIALVFGSYATKRARSDSDLDVAVAYGGKLSLTDRVALGQRLSQEVNKEVDGGFKSEVRHGKPLKAFYIRGIFAACY